MKAIDFNREIRVKGSHVEAIYIMPEENGRGHWVALKENGRRPITRLFNNVGVALEHLDADSDDDYGWRPLGSFHFRRAVLENVPESHEVMVDFWKSPHWRNYSNKKLG